MKQNLICTLEVWSKPKSAEKPKEEEPKKKKGDLGGTMQKVCAVMLDEFEISEEGAEPSAKELIEDSCKHLRAGEMTMGMMMWLNDVLRKVESKKRNAQVRR